MLSPRQSDLWIDLDNAFCSMSVLICWMHLSVSDCIIVWQRGNGPDTSDRYRSRNLQSTSVPSGRRSCRLTCIWRWYRRGRRVPSCVWWPFACLLVTPLSFFHLFQDSEVSTQRPVASNHDPLPRIDFSFSTKDPITSGSALGSSVCCRWVDGTSLRISVLSSWSCVIFALSSVDSC